MGDKFKLYLKRKWDLLFTWKAVIHKNSSSVYNVVYLWYFSYPKDFSKDMQENCLESSTFYLI
jgi:hypothetical protein